MVAVGAGWRSALAVAGAVIGVLLVSGLVAVLQSRGGGPAVAGGDVSGLPAADAGQRWVSWHDVAVQVPVGWGYGTDPGDQWCADNGLGPMTSSPPPYVTLDPTYGFHTEVGCRSTETHDPAFGPAPAFTWADHVDLESPQGPDGTWRDGGWTLTARTVGDAQVRVLSHDPSQVNAILASARTITTDEAGCPVSSPIQAATHVRPDPVDLASIRSVDTVSVCQYQRAIPGGQPGLMGGQTITGAAAGAYLDSVRAAPDGSGPDRPDDCAPSVDGDTAVVVRLWSGATSHDLYAYYEGCRGLGIDDGVSMHRLTSGDCAPLFASPPVVLWQFDQVLMGLCTSNQR